MRLWLQFDPEESDGDMSLPTRDAEEFRCDALLLYFIVICT